MLTLWTILGALALFLALGFVGAPLIVWTAGGAVVLLVFGGGWIALAVYAVFAVVFNLRPVRHLLVGAPLMRIFKAAGVFPPISETERVALEAGTVWLDGELFSGKPDLNRALAEPYPEIDAEVKEFLEGPCAVVSEMTNDWDVHLKKDLPEEVWAYLKREKFFGLIIPKEYGGMGFNANQVSAVIQYLSTRSFPLAVTVMIPNSLGPAELLLHDGTDTQRNEYLPKLATGESIPAFALTEPGAGSDAGAMSASGEVFRDSDGELKLRLNFNKRYISLATVSTILGLAFKLRDPENLLGKGEDPGITCALIPSDTPGVIRGRRHDPLGCPFHNCPVEGKDVIVPVSTIIGGENGAGEGWRMLMACLAAGRGVALPSSSVAGAKRAARLGGAYSMVRRQFGMRIGRFEGIEERLARVAGFTYLMDAARVFTCGAVSAGAKPAVVTAILKYNQTDLARQMVNDVMDIVGGAGISRGPRNQFASGYMATPIAITVEGANILTRSMIVFGQGAIRCHPFAYKQMVAVNESDSAAFDAAIFGHIGHVVRNLSRSILLSVTRGRLAPAPAGVAPAMAHYWRKISWCSATYALVTDIAMLSLQGDLKRRESLTGRMADILSWMFLALSTLRRFEAEGRQEADLGVAKFALDSAFAKIQESFDEVFRNFPHRALGLVFGGPVALWSRMNTVSRGPTDRVAAKAAATITSPGDARDRLTAGMHRPTGDDAAAVLEEAFVLAHQSLPIEKKIRKAMAEEILPKGRVMTLVDMAVEKGVISSADSETLKKATEARRAAIEVDSFPIESFVAETPTPGLDPVGQ